MASFLVFVPRAGINTTVDQLAHALRRRGVKARASVEESRGIIEFDGTSDLLYLTLIGDCVRRAELSPDNRGKARTPERILIHLDAIGYDYIDEDDPRWTEGEARPPSG